VQGAKYVQCMIDMHDVHKVPDAPQLMSTIYDAMACEIFRTDVDLTEDMRVVQSL
jgi:hypothetical protein